MFLIRQLGAGLLLSCLVAVDAVRVADDVAEVDEKDGEMVATEDTRDDQPLVTSDYWTLDYVGARCRAARRGRNSLRWAGGVVGALLMVPTAYLTWYASLWTVYQVSYGVYLFIVGGFLDVPIAAWGAYLGGRAGVGLVSSGINRLSILFGQDHKPACCCTDGSSNGGEKLCALIGSVNSKRATCPDSAPHWQADQCNYVAPALTFDANLTAGGCTCVDVADCSSNKYWKGHPWCQVSDSEDCAGRRFRLNPFKRWDYCQVAPVDVVENGETVTFNQNIAKFTVNEGRRFALDPRFVFRFGSWVDTSKAVVIAPIVVGGEKRSACMPGLPEETLDGCAQLCIDDGAIIADEADGPTQTVECVAFAYNHHHRLCVRIPDNATGAVFKPYARNPELEGARRDGWSNYKKIV